jgi:ribosomal protein S18 acetylase RimI-like enzyme
MACSAVDGGPVEVNVAASDEQWEAVRRLTAEMVEWLQADLGLDVRKDQHDSNEELDALATFYSPPRGRMLLGSVGENACGTTGVYLLAPGRAELRRVWVSPEWRGHGLASQLLRTGIECARKMGASTVVLETAKGHMDRAIGMYRRAGFREIAPYSSLPEALPSVITMGLTLE